MTELEFNENLSLSDFRWDAEPNDGAGGCLFLVSASKAERTMNHEERFNVKRGAQGCLVASAILVVLNLFIGFVITEWLGLISIETEKTLLAFVWLFAVCFAGYVAARLGRTTSWTNSLVVGLIAEFVVYTRLPKGGEGQILLDPLLETIKDPVTHWPRLVWLGLTIPVAILGGFIWQKSGNSSLSDSSSTETENNP